MQSIIRLPYSQQEIIFQRINDRALPLDSTYAQSLKKEKILWGDQQLTRSLTYPLVRHPFSFVAAVDLNFDYLHYLLLLSYQIASLVPGGRYLHSLLEIL